MLKEIVLDGWLKTDLEGPLDEVIENLQNLKEEYSKDFKDLRIDIDSYEDGDYSIQLIGFREETQIEADTRKSVEEADLKRQRELDLKQLEILKKKYE
jgi:hypothetical protein